MFTTFFQLEPIEQLRWAYDTHLAAPELLDVVSLQTLCRLERLGSIPASRSNLPSDLKALPIRRYRHGTLIDGIWTLRGNLTCYDAAYVVLTRLLNAALVTRDERLARAVGLGDRVLLP